MAAINIEKIGTDTARLTFTDRDGFTSVEYLTETQWQEIGHQMGWKSLDGWQSILATPDDPAAPYNVTDAWRKEQKVTISRYGANNTEHTGEDGYLPALN